MQRIYHLLLSTNPGYAPLRHQGLCAHLWQHLGQRFPQVWAAVLMPDHVHVIVETSHPLDARRTLAIEARAACRIFFPGKRIWAPSPEPKHIPNTLHLKRTIRYIHLNPCRDGLACDPIEWEWSTHRDVLGVTNKSWVDLRRLAETFRLPMTRLAEGFHSYVSSDPDVAVTGTPLIRPIQEDTPFAATPRMCARAIAAVSRSDEKDALKRGELRDATIQLSVLTARNPRKIVSDALQVDERTLRRALSRPHDSVTLNAAKRYLSDPRCYKLRGVE